MENLNEFNEIDLLEPIELYKTKLKDGFHENAIKLYEDMADRAGTNIAANQAFCKTYYEEMDIVKNLSKKKSGKVVGLIFTIIGIVLLILGGAGLIVFAAMGNLPMEIGIPVGIACVLGGVGLIFLAVKLGKDIKNLQKDIDEHQKKADDAKAAAENEMATLLGMYEWNMAAVLMTKTTPLIQLDQIFDGEKYQYLHDKFGYKEYTGVDISSVYVQSGAILGNPFVFEKNYVQTMRNHRYSGTLTITWTERVSNGKGGYSTVTRSQVLTAYYTAPEPAYYYDTWLIYGNEAAPKLSFSRTPTDINNMNDKQIENYIKNFDKKLNKMTEKATAKGNPDFTRLPDEEFEALFNALDRDNDVEFRLLFSPLAQKNMVKLLRGKDVAFGDDFIFKKRKKLNYIKSAHQQGSDSLDKNPASLYHFDYKVAKEIFVNYCDKYLKDVFFDLAPLISIPLYQSTKTEDYIYDNKFKYAYNITTAEVESAANSHNISLFRHPATRSAGVILKANHQSMNGDYDICSIDAHSFEGIDRVEYVPTMGGDGHMHNVPVHWVEYRPICKTTPFAIADTKTDKATFTSDFAGGKFNKILSSLSSAGSNVYKKRLFSFVMKDK